MSETFIFTYQDSIEETKDLVNEILRLSNITDKTADDIFWYALFYDNATYLENDVFYSHFKDKLELLDYKTQNQWLCDLKLSIMKDEIEKPQCMKEIKTSSNINNSYYLYLIPKDEKYINLANKIENLLMSVTSDSSNE
jgi:hypothetical protein